MNTKRKVELAYYIIPSVWYVVTLICMLLGYPLGLLNFMLFFFASLFVGVGTVVLLSSTYMWTINKSDLSWLDTVKVIINK